jgi:hypothetical protein
VAINKLTVCASAKFKRLREVRQAVEVGEYSIAPARVDMRMLTAQRPADP